MKLLSPLTESTHETRWTHDSLHGTLETNFRRCFSVNLWCGMTDYMMIDPVILDDRNTGHNYLDFL
jgi:hypothetical protein